MNIIINWVTLIGRELTMEETFIVTGIAVFIISVLFGFLLEYIFRKENERQEAEDDNT